FVFVIAQQRHCNFLLLRPRLLRERIVTADPINGRVQVAVGVQPGTNLTHLRRAGARERHGKEKKQRVFLSEIIAELDLFRPVSGLRGQSEIWRLSSNRKWHK